MVAVGAAAIGFAWAHAGHKALPTQGSTIDGDRVLLSQQARTSIGLTTLEVSQKTLDRAVLATAHVVTPPQRHGFASTRVAGRIRRVLVSPGQRVQAGQKLADMESAELQSLQAQLIQGTLALDLVTTTLHQLELLAKRQDIPIQKLATVRSNYRAKAADVEITRRKLEALGLTAENLHRVVDRCEPVPVLPIIAPISGVVLHADVSLGQMVEPTQHLFEILDLATVWVEAQVPEAAVYRVRLGQPVRIVLAAYPNQTLEARLELRDMQIDPATHCLRVWAPLDNSDGRLKPGLFGRMGIVVEQAKNAVACPVEAIMSEGAETYTFIEERAGEYLRRPLRRGLATPDFLQVTDGLFPGDRVVAHGSHELAALFVQGVLQLSEPAEQNMGLQTEAAARRPIDEVVEAYANIAVPPAHQAFASTPVPAKVATILVKPGQAVNAGQPLGEIESLALETSQWEWLQTRIRLELARATLGRLRPLESAGSVPLKDLLQAENAASSAQAELETLRGKLLLMGLSADQIERIDSRRELVHRLPIRAPIAGAVVHVDVAVGQVVKPEEHLFEIHDLSTMWVEGQFFETDLARLRIGQTTRIRVTSDPTLMIEGKLAGTNSALQPSGGVLTGWAQAPNPGHRLLNTMQAQMTVVVGTRPATLAVSRGAVLAEGTRSSVFIRSGQEFQKVRVKVGCRDDRFVEIRSGLDEGTRVVSRGVEALQTAFAMVK